jgi:LemA protein
MMKWLGCLGVLVVIALIAGAFALGVRNDLVNKEEAVNAQWGQVENVYQRRADLIPNLVATVKGAADFEKSTLESVVQARASVGQVNMSNLPNDPAGFAKFQQAQDALSGALSRLLVVVERYPDIKANQNFLALQDQLEGTENRIAVARRDYIDAVRDYNTFRRRFPTNLVAGMFGFEKQAQLQIDAEERETPQVEFDFNNDS